MGRNVFSWLALTCVWAVSVAGAADNAPLVNVLPDGALVRVDLSQADELIGRIQNSEIAREAYNSPAYDKWLKSGDGKRFHNGRKIVEAQLGIDLWTAAKRLLGDQVAWGVYPPNGKPQPESVLIVQAGDAEILELIRQKSEPFLGLTGDAVKMSQDGDAWVFEFPNDGRGRLIGSRLVVATSDALLQQTVERLKSVPAAATGDLSSATVLNARSELSEIRKLVGTERLAPPQLDNPVGSLLIGGLVEMFAVGSDAKATLSLNDRGLNLVAKLAGDVTKLDTAHQTFFQKSVPAASAAFPEVPRQLASWSIYRDWANWYRHRDELLEAKLLPDFDKFETGLATLLPGKDFAEDVLAHLTGPITFVSAEQTYPHLQGQPGVKLPAFATVLELNDPTKGSEVFQLFFQTITTITNLQSQQYGRQPWILSSESHNGVQISFAKYLETPKGDSLPIVVNFQPAGALVGQYYVSATSLELCRDLVDRLKSRGPAEAARSDAGPRRNLSFTLDPQVGAKLLLANAAMLEARGVQDGKSAEQSAQELKVLTTLLQGLAPLVLTTNVANDGVTIELNGGWR